MWAPSMLSPFTRREKISPSPARNGSRRSSSSTSSTASRRLPAGPRPSPRTRRAGGPGKRGPFFPPEGGRPLLENPPDPLADAPGPGGLGDPLALVLELRLQRLAQRPVVQLLRPRVGEGGAGGDARRQVRPPDPER